MGTGDSSLCLRDRLGSYVDSAQAIRVDASDHKPVQLESSPASHLEDIEISETPYRSTRQRFIECQLSLGERQRVSRSRREISPRVHGTGPAKIDRSDSLDVLRRPSVWAHGHHLAISESSLIRKARASVHCHVTEMSQFHSGHATRLGPRVAYARA